MIEYKKILTCDRCSEVHSETIEAAAYIMGMMRVTTVMPEGWHVVNSEIICPAHTVTVEE